MSDYRQQVINGLVAIVQQRHEQAAAATAERFESLTTVYPDGYVASNDGAFVWLGYTFKPCMFGMYGQEHARVATDVRVDVPRRTWYGARTDSVEQTLIIRTPDDLLALLTGAQYAPA
jgi:hypothetical protein